MLDGVGVKLLSVTYYWLDTPLNILGRQYFSFIYIIRDFRENMRKY
jgi:hypothetical protein